MAQATPLRIHVTGHVLGPDAKSMRGAVVALVPNNAGSGLSPIHEQLSGPRGAFSLEAPAGAYGLTVTAPGCLPHFRNLELKPGAPSLPLEIRLEKGGLRLKGRILPAPGCKLEAVRLGFSKVSQDSGDQFFSVVRQGRFDITLAPGAYQAEVAAKGQIGGQHIELREAIQDASIKLTAEPCPADGATLAWIKRNAIPLKGAEAGKGFADMQPLKALVGDATVVALGEATHGTREFFQLKHRMLEFLATQMGFTVFAIEANLPEAFAVNDYVLTGKGDPAKALAGLYFWTWNTEEVLDMIRWMRTYNEDPAHTKKLRFYGVDMQTETVAYAQAKTWLDGVDTTEAGKLLEIKQSLAKLPSRSSGKPTEETLKAWGSAAQALEAMITRLEARTFPGEDFDRQRQNLRVFAQFNTMQADPSGGYAVRDASMAANLRWIQAREQGAKIVLWAHNGHITFHPIPSTGGINTMGWHLRQGLGKAYLPIGFAFREGAFQAISGDPNNRGLKVCVVKPQASGTLDAALAATRLPILALDLRSRPSQGPVKRWLESSQGTWSIGALFTPGQEQHFVSKRPITEDYDALFFVNRTTSATPVGGRTQVPVHAAQAKTPLNLGFEEGLTGWSNPKDLGYTATVVDQGAKEGGRCLQVTYQGEPKPNAWWTAMQSVEAESFRGKNVRLTAWIRTDAKPDFKAMCWVRVNHKNGMGFFDNMMQRPVTGTDWTEITIEGPVAEDAVTLNFGCMAMGAGTAWFDGIRVERVP
ncbi:MAG TPA: erythromycin esterase family protein [Geothrix sp.]|nr:erythromycin esterase family protein [Geothrix sp.]